MRQCPLFDGVICYLLLIITLHNLSLEVTGNIARFINRVVRWGYRAGQRLIGNHYVFKGDEGI